MLTYPQIDSVAFHLGPLAVRWYGLMYMAGFVCAYGLILKLVKSSKLEMSHETIADLLFACVLGVVIGGRLGYVLFYNGTYYWHHPQEILYLWQGGMSFHGGLSGVIVASVWFIRKRELPMGQLADILVISSCCGLFFGRIGNFINGELWGRVTTVPWAMVFPGAGPYPRHPSQLYEALLEGPIMLLLLWLVYRRNLKPWSVFCAFISLYALFRFAIEFVRQPDAQLGILSSGLTMGQMLSIPMILAGVTGLIFLNWQKNYEKY
ncbi:MAG: prolipoprotein diacylglyceryl transferase [Desulfuromonas sp.]|nr:prolipoprotein diacylglyceryl transferase [Desulfuromonas sp.]